jgi:hypothetical protein
MVSTRSKEYEEVAHSVFVDRQGSQRQCDGRVRQNRTKANQGNSGHADGSRRRIPIPIARISIVPARQNGRGFGMRIFKISGLALADTLGNVTDRYKFARLHDPR